MKKYKQEQQNLNNCDDTKRLGTLDFEAYSIWVFEWFSLISTFKEAFLVLLQDSSKATAKAGLILITEIYSIKAVTKILHVFFIKNLLWYSATNNIITKESNYIHYLFL